MFWSRCWPLKGLIEWLSRTIELCNLSLKSASGIRRTGPQPDVEKHSEVCFATDSSASAPAQVPPAARNAVAGGDRWQEAADRKEKKGGAGSREATALPHCAFFCSRSGELSDRLAVAKEVLGDRGGGSTKAAAG